MTVLWSFTVVSAKVVMVVKKFIAMDASVLVLTLLCQGVKEVRLLRERHTEGNGGDRMQRNS